MNEIYGKGNYVKEGPRDQTDKNWAVIYMQRRIKLVTDACISRGCRDTDVFIVVALAQNGPGFGLSDISKGKNGIKDALVGTNDCI
jgi:hypothetical protein